MKKLLNTSGLKTETENLLELKKLIFLKIIIIV